MDLRGEVREVAVATGNPPYDTVLATIALNPESKPFWIGLNAKDQNEIEPGKYMAYFKPYLDQQRLKGLRREVHLERAGYSYVEQGQAWVEKVTWVPTKGDHSRSEVVAATAHILGHVLDRAISDGASPDAEIWLGMPVTFSSCARKRMIRALYQAVRGDGSKLFDGYKDILDRVRFALEPVAVAAGARADMQVEHGETVLIFDHGGGTLDLSLIQFETRAGLVMPVAGRELAAGGSGLVAGRKMDEAFREKLLADSPIKAALDKVPAYIRDDFIERCKIDLSTKTTAELQTTGISVERVTFEEAVKPILAKLEAEIKRTVAAGGISMGAVDWVVMTGGSSLIPVVQHRLKTLFPRLDSDSRILHYFADDTGRGGGVERAITDVARGLAAFGQQTSLDEIVLWDVLLQREGNGASSVLFERGTPLERDGDGRPELRRRIPVEPGDDGGTCFAVYEDQLDRHFVFGIADGPAIPAGSELLISIRRDALFPSLALVTDGGVLTHASLDRLDDRDLERFFDQDAEYLPIAGFKHFERAPLERRLRIDDIVEWTLQLDLRTKKWDKRRHRGEVLKIRRYQTGEYLEEMDCWDLSAFQFTVKDHKRPGLVHQVETRNGYIRLAPRPDSDF